MTFVRSGGLAGAPGLRVAASVRVDWSGGEVVAPAYLRQVGAAEAAALLADGEAIASSAHEMHVRTGASSPDAFRFSFTIQTGTDAVEVPSGAELGAARASLDRLLAWAGKEAQEIVQHRLTMPPPR
jgi:hypothetical protein